MPMQEQSPIQNVAALAPVPGLLLGAACLADCTSLPGPTADRDGRQMVDTENSSGVHALAPALAGHRGLSRNDAIGARTSRTSRPHEPTNDSLIPSLPIVDSSETPSPKSGLAWAKASPPSGPLLFGRTRRPRSLPYGFVALSARLALADTAER
jgi:hypothetical protein